MIVALFMNIMVLMDPLVLAVLYIWCQLNKDTITTFWFGTQFKAMYLPWVLFAFNLIIANGGVMELIGILIGHLYFFLMFTYPQVRIMNYKVTLIPKYKGPIANCKYAVNSLYKLLSFLWGTMY